MGDNVWQGYIDNSLIGSGTMESACIVGLDGGYWAYGGSVIPQPDEVKHILACIADPSKGPAGGVHIAGNKYMVMRADEDGFFAKLQAGGAVVKKATQCVIIGVFNGKTGTPADGVECNVTVDNIIKYLKDNGY